MSSNNCVLCLRCTVSSAFIQQQMGTKNCPKFFKKMKKKERKKPEVQVSIVIKVRQLLGLQAVVSSALLGLYPKLFRGLQDDEAREDAASVS